MGTIVIGEIESGRCRVGDQCSIMPNRTRVKVTNIYYENVGVESCLYEENVRLKLKNVEEKVNVLLFINDHYLIKIFREISPGFILCNAQQTQVICMEPFKHFRGFSRFTLLDKVGPVNVGKVLKIIR